MYYYYFIYFTEKIIQIFSYYYHGKYFGHTITLAGSLDIKFNMTLNDIYPALPKGSQTSGFVFIFIS